MSTVKVVHYTQDYMVIINKVVYGRKWSWIQIQMLKHLLKWWLFKMNVLEQQICLIS